MTDFVTITIGRKWYRMLYETADVITRDHLPSPDDPRSVIPASIPIPLGQKIVWGLVAFAAVYLAIKFVLPTWRALA